MTDFYRFRAEAGENPNKAELLIFGPIGDWEDMGEVSAKGFAKALAALPSSVKALDIHINSPGGSVFEAQAIYSRLADHRSDKTVYVDGIAASAASIIAMVGKKIYIRANATMMIHMPWGVVLGSASEMRHYATILDTLTESMVNVYEKKTGKERKEILDMLEAETWFSPDDAVEHGFADEVRGVVKAAAMIGDKKAIINGLTVDLTRFHNIPASLINASTTTEGDTMPKGKPKATGSAGEGGAPTTTQTEETTTQTEETTTTTEETPTTTTQTEETTTTQETVQNDYDKGVKAERARIVALQKQDRPSTHEIISAAIADGRTLGDIAGELADAIEKAANQTNRRTDASALDSVPGGSADNGKKDEGFADKVRTAAQNKAKARAKSRGLVGGRN